MRVTYGLLRAHGLTTIFGNPGSTGETFLENFPADFRPGLDLPGLDLVSIAQGHGCHAVRTADLDTIKQAAAAAWAKVVPTVLGIPASPRIPRWSEVPGASAAPTCQGAATAVAGLP